MKSYVVDTLVHSMDINGKKIKVTTMMKPKIGAQKFSYTEGFYQG